MKGTEKLGRCVYMVCECCVQGGGGWRWRDRIQVSDGMNVWCGLDESRSMFKKSFPQCVRPTLRYILSEFGCRSPLRRPHPNKISHKLWRTSCVKHFSNTLWYIVFEITIPLTCLRIRLHRSKSLSVARYACVFIPAHSNPHPTRLV